MEVSIIVAYMGKVVLMKFLNTAEKIKKIRKQLKMNQEDLVDGSITRGFISMIETGRRGISRDTAEIIFKKFKNRAEKLGIELDMDADYLVRDSKAEAESYCTQQLENIKETNDIENIIDIAKEYKLENIFANAYSRLGKIAFDEKDYIKAYTSYLNALDRYKVINMTNMEPYLYNRLGHCKLNQLELLEALAYFNIANYHATLLNDNNIKKLSIYNIALCNKKLNRVDAALEYIDIYLSLCDKEKNFTVYTYANILKANCYEVKNSIDTSIGILIDLLKEFKNSDDPLIGYIYNNLGMFYLQKPDLEKSLDYFERAQKIREEKDTCNLFPTLIEKSRVYIEQKFFDKAISSLKEGLDLAYENNDIEYLLKGYYMLANIYINLQSNQEAINAYESLLDLLQKINNDLHKDKLINVYSRLSYLYFQQDNHEKLREILLILNRITEV